MSRVLGINLHPKRGKTKCLKITITKLLCGSEFVFYGTIFTKLNCLTPKVNLPISRSLRVATDYRNWGYQRQQESEMLPLTLSPAETPRGLASYIG